MSHKNREKLILPKRKYVVNSCRFLRNIRYSRHEVLRNFSAVFGAGYLFTFLLPVYFPSCPFMCSKSSGDQRSIYINMAYSEGSRYDAATNLRYFLRHGVTQIPFRKQVMYGIVTSCGKCRDEAAINPTAFVRASAKALTRHFPRDNVGYDWGGHGHALRELKKEEMIFDFYFFLNCGVVGPILPSYVPNCWHWTSAFVDRVHGNVGIVSSVIACLPTWDLGGYGPKVEGFSFVLSRRALEVLVKKSIVFENHPDKVHAAIHGEYALSNVLLANGIGMDCLLKAYQGIDRFDKDEWDCNNGIHATRNGSYFGTTLNPLEVIFHKKRWGGFSGPTGPEALPEAHPVSEMVTQLYEKWADEADARVANLSGVAK